MLLDLALALSAFGTAGLVFQPVLCTSMQDVESALLQEGALTRLVVRLLKISGHTMRSSDPRLGRFSTAESAVKALEERPGGQDGHVVALTGV
jgi:hypothetical protein